MLSALAIALLAAPDAGVPSRVDALMASMSDREKVAQLLIAYPQVDKTGPVEVGGVLFVGNVLRDLKKAKAKIESTVARAKIPPFTAAARRWCAPRRSTTSISARDV